MLGRCGGVNRCMATQLQRSIMTSVSPKLLNFDSFNDIVRPLFYCDFMQVLFYWLSFCIFL